MSSADEHVASKGEWLLRYVRAAGNLRGMTQLNEIAAAAGISPQAMRDWASKGARPSRDTIEALADAVGLIADEIDRFVYRGGPPPKLQPAQPATRYAVVLPLPTLRRRRKRWLEFVRRIRWQWSPEEAALAAQTTLKEYQGWESGVDEPQGAERPKLFSAFDIPEWLFDNPPATDEERLALWHVDSPIELREAV